MELHSIYHYLKTIESQGSRYGIETMKRLLEALGHPEEQLKIVHIAGTNGKGSTLAHLAAICIESGYSVMRYVSPMWKTYLDRFLLNRNPVNEALFIPNMEKVIHVSQQLNEHPSIFEMELACAYLMAIDAQVDIFLQETGLGGRLDATNAISSPILTVFSEIDYDHTQLLGDTLEKITKEKAAIIKNNAPVVFTEHQKNIDDILIQTAKHRAVSYTCVRKNDINCLSLSLEGTKFTYKDRTYHTRLIGFHQTYNAALAVEAADQLSSLGFTHLTAENIQKGLRNVIWKGRLECIAHEPAIFLDGAHNPNGAHALSTTIEKLISNETITKPYIMLHCFKDKDVLGILHELKPIARAIIPIDLNFERSLKIDELIKHIHAVDIPIIQPRSTLEETISYTMTSLVKPEDSLIVAGSLSHLSMIEDHLYQYLGE